VWLPFFAIAAGIALAAWAMRDRSVKPDPEMQTWPIGDAPHDRTVKLIGTVRAHGKTVRTPIGDVECCFYDVRMIEPGLEGGHYVTKAQVAGAPFELDDDSGTVLVDAHGDFDLVVHRTALGYTKAPTDAMVRFAGDAYRGSFLSASFEERYIEPGTRLAITGIIEKKPDGTLQIRPFTLSNKQDALWQPSPTAKQWWR
jgi:hypothetical protein